VWFTAALIRATLREKDLLPKLTLAGFLPLSLAVVNDLLYAQLLVQTAYVAHYGMCTFILFQSLLLAVANARARKHSETSAQELTVLNEELRRQIGDRSHRLAETLTLLASDARKVSELQPGTVMAGRYRIERLLGAGGMGAVYGAVRLADEKAVALKVVKLSASPAMLARFAREAEAAAKVNHPNVVAILDVDIGDDGELFIVMERVIGHSLDAVRSRFGNADWALPLLEQLAAALEAIHAADVIHRDLKPSNILLTEQGVLKVADFGIAGLRTAGDTQGSTTNDSADDETVDGKDPDATGETSPALTQAGAVLGSPMYMSPEARAGAQHTSASSDLFSFGLVAYEMLCGQPAFQDLLAVTLAAVRPPTPLVTRCPSLASDVATIVDACLKHDPRARPSAAEVHAVLARHAAVRSSVG
jgi:serine/threonine-protein kinase